MAMIRWLVAKNGLNVAKLMWIQRQRLVWPGSQSITFDIASRRFEKKKPNNCCEFFFNGTYLLFINLQIHNLAILILLAGRSSRRVAKNGIFANFCFTIIIVLFFFKTSGYNVKCDILWDRSNRSLVLKLAYAIAKAIAYFCILKLE